jgi:peptide/nickel transport system permease protein
MGAYALRRLLQAVPVAFFSTIIVFLLLRAIPGDPAVVMAGPQATPEIVALIREDMGLNEPLPVQYGVWMGHLLRGDLGRSALSGQPILKLFEARLPASLELIVAAMLLSMIIGFPTGVTAALKSRHRADWIISTWNSLMMAIPQFWTGILFILLFALVLGWLPPGSRVADGRQLGLSIKTLILPALALALPLSSNLSRFVKAAMLDVMYDDFVRTAWAKGLAARAVVTHHELRNALLPVVTILGLQFSVLLSGTVLIESVFSWPGLGSMLLDAIGSRDYVIVQEGLLFLVLMIIAINLATDISYGILNPRIRLGNR